MGYKETPRIRKQGGSYYVTIPKQWLEFWNLKEGDKIVQLGDSVIVLAPDSLESKARKIILNAEGNK